MFLVRLIERVKKHRITATILTLITLITAISSFTEATKHLWELIPDKRPNLNGIWIADVKYDWLNTSIQETFVLSGTGDKLEGTASFLRVERLINEGKIQKSLLDFVTKTQEILGNQGNKEVTHVYSGEFQKDRIKFTLKSEGGFSNHLPIEFVAIRKLSSSQKPSFQNEY